MPGGFGEGLGNDVLKLHKAIQPCKNVLAAAREADLLVLHTREGHRTDMADLLPHKKRRLGHEKQVIGSEGPNGKILLRGEKGHDIISELYPQKGEPVIDKPGKGSFYSTDVDLILKAQDIQTLVVMGVTRVFCVNTRVRYANDRGYHCIVISDACASFFNDFHDTALRMITAQGGIFGSVTGSAAIIKAFSTICSKGEEKG